MKTFIHIQSSYNNKLGEYLYYTLVSDRVTNYVSVMQLQIKNRNIDDLIHHLLVDALYQMKVLGLKPAKGYYFQGKYKQKATN